MKRIRNLLVLIISLLGIYSQAYAVPTLSIGSAKGEPGGILYINLSLSGGTESYAGVNAKIILPADFIITSISKGPLLTSDFTIDWRNSVTAGGNEVTVIAYSSIDTISAVNGILLIIALEASFDAQPGIHPMIFSSTNPDPLINSKYALSNIDGSVSVVPAAKSGTIRIGIEDTDSDGLSDKWEQLIVMSDPNDNIIDIDDVNPKDDLDGDRFSNLREFLSGTDANSSEDIPPCLADYHWDNDVDGEDSSMFVIEYGRDDCSLDNPCDWDLNGDNLVNNTDLLFFSEDFGRTDCTQ